MYVPALLIGARNLSLKYLLHPLTYSLKDSLLVMAGGSYFVSTWKGDPGLFNADKYTFKYLVNKLWSLPAMPVIFLPIFCIIYFHLYVPVLIGFGLILAAIAIVGLIVFSSGGGWRTAFYILCDLVDKLLGPKNMWYLDQDEMDMLMCDGKGAKKLSDLPFRKRTLKLRFQNIKSKVCRPFSA